MVVLPYLSLPLISAVGVICEYISECSDIYSYSSSVSSEREAVLVTVILIWSTPISAKLPIMEFIYPVTMDTSMITEATPMIMPSIVKNERILFAAIERIAILKLSIFLRTAVKCYPAVHNLYYSLSLNCECRIM